MLPMSIEPRGTRRGAARLVFVCLEEDAWVGRAVGEDATCRVG